ncbi:MAG TPA: AAA family ATPase, partial [Polyangiales bacterium]
LNVIQAELRRAEQGAEVLLCVQGEGGIGKTALVGEALEQLALHTPGARVLRSRCYANEQLRLQAFDGAVDELARELNRLTQPELEAVLPPRAALLSQLFPVLGSVPMIRGATKKGCPAEPSARRAAAIEAFIELLVRLSQRSLLVLAIDDLQWADAESFTLLRALLHKHPGVKLAVVAMLRPHEARSGEVRESLSQLVARTGAVSLALDKLGDDDALVLARRLFGPKLSDAELAMAVRESAGHPLFLRELAQARVSLGSSAGLDLEQALLRRMAALGPDACTLLELLTLLARPCPAHVLERAAGLGQAFDDALRELLRTELVQRRGPLGLACFHDRLREAVLGQIPAARVRRLSGPLAEALEAEAEADPVECARLWDAAGDATRACTAYGLAGDRALESLSFAAAERLYARALELSANAVEPPLVRLRSQRGHAFVALGRSAEAASQFEEAAQRASGAEAIRLRVLAAQHQIQSAQFDDGIRNARVVLKELGVPLPQGERSALARIAWERGLLATRGTKVKVRTEIDPLAMLRLDAIAGLSLPLCWSEFLPGTALSMVYLRRALVLGESNHAARALSQEATLRAVLGEHAACSALFAQAISLAAQSQVPGAVAFVEFGEGSAALMHNELSLALSKCLSAEDLLLTSCPEEAWLLTNVRMTICIVLMRLGEYQRLADSFKHWFAQAQARRDAFASTALFGLGLGHTTFLMEDRVAEAFATLDEVMRPWKQRPSGFSQGGELFGRMSLGLYAGGSGAYRWFWEEARAEHDRSFFLRHGDMHTVLLSGRVTSALAARAEASKPEQRADLLARARSSARAMTAKGIGALMRPLAFAQLHALEGNVDAAMDLARQTVHICEQRGEAGHRNGAEYMLGMLEGGEGGRLRREASLEFFRARGWKEPLRAVTAFVPAVRELNAK